jgi:Arc/MetJ-type ribon-helix-helix transcriptional regulator
MTIHLPPSLEGPILAAVQSGRFASLDDAMSEAASLLLQRLEQEQSRPDLSTVAGPAEKPVHCTERKPLWERAADLRESIPDEEWAKLPPDGADQLDHYL